MKRFILFATALILTSCASIRISSDYDTNVDFSTYTTYAFFKPGIDKVEISDLDKRRVLRALESTLPKRAYGRHILVRWSAKPRALVFGEKVSLAWERSEKVSMPAPRRAQILL